MLTLCMFAIKKLQPLSDKFMEVLMVPTTDTFKDGSALPAAAMFTEATSEFGVITSMLNQAKARVHNSPTPVLFGVDQVKVRVETSTMILGIISNFKGQF